MPAILLPIQYTVFKVQHPCCCSTFQLDCFSLYCTVDRKKALIFPLQFSSSKYSPFSLCEASSIDIQSMINIGSSSPFSIVSHQKQTWPSGLCLCSLHSTALHSVLLSMLLYIWPSVLSLFSMYLVLWSHATCDSCGSAAESKTPSLSTRSSGHLLHVTF